MGALRRNVGLIDTKGCSKLFPVLQSPPAPMSHPNRPFSTLVICVTGLSKDARKQVKEATEKLGGEYSPHLHLRCTHLVVQSSCGRKFEHTLKHGARNGLFVVTIGWFVDSVRRNLRMSESLYTVKQIEQNGGKTDELSGGFDLEHICRPRAIQQAVQLSTSKKYNQLSSGTESSGTSEDMTLPDHSMYLDSDISDELRVKVLQVARDQGAKLTDSWFIGCNATLVVCEGASVQRYLGHANTIVSPLWVLKTVEKHRQRLVHISPDLARQLGLMLENLEDGATQEKICSESSPQDALKIRNKSVEDRKEIVNIAKTGVRRRRALHMQTCQNPIRRITPNSLLENICWTISEPASTAALFTDSGSSTDNISESQRGSDPVASFSNSTRALTESEKTEVIFKDSFLTILYPADRFSEMGPSSRTYFCDNGFTCFQILDYIHRFYSSGRVNPGSQGFRFGSDDILSSYDDYTNQDSSNGLNSDPAMTSTNSNQEFNTSRMDRSSGFPLRSYSPPEDALSQDITATVERTMKKYADNMMRFLEGISSRLSQLELYCYNLDKTIGEMRSDLTREHEEADVKLRSLDKHLQEVHRSVQILRDKQELADTQKELAKLQLVQKEPSLSSHSQQVEERVPNPVPEPKTCDNTPDTHNHQLALALPHQVTPQPQPQQAPPHQHYYTPAAAPVHVPAPALAPPQQPQPPPTQGQFMSTPPLPSQPTAVQQTQSFSQYQQQTWPPQQMQSQQLQPQVRLQSSGPYPTYSPAPPSNQPPVESLPSSMPMQPQYSGPPPAQAMQGYGYGAPPRTGAPQQQINNSSYGPQPGDGYLPSGPHTSPPPPDRYAMYESGDSGRMHYPPPQQQNHAPQGGYSSPQQQQSDGRNPGPSPPQFSRPNSAYRELMEKLMNMGFRGEHVASVIQTMEESNQPIDFNAVLDRLNVQFSGGPPPPRRW